MNIIRTTAIELTTIPAITYKQKLASGGAGIKILRLDQEAASFFTLDKRTGEALPYGPYDAGLFPYEAIDEATELTTGLPYTSRGKLTITIQAEENAATAPADATAAAMEAEDVPETETEKTDMVNSDEYRAFLYRYTNEKGKLNYPLMNKDFIQFASGSKTVENMVAANADVDNIVLFIVNNRAASLAGKKDLLNDLQTAALIETLDEIDPRSAFKELKLYIRRLLAKNAR